MSIFKKYYFSQHGEDAILWQFFGNKKEGFFVDVGAFDGVHLSNTFSFEQQGWRGICIEPHPDFFQLCQFSRPNSICLNVACIDNDEINVIEFYVEETGLLSGIKLDNIDIQQRYDKRGLKLDGLQKVHVPATTLNTILQERSPPDNKIDFISIDVEGAEINVLQGFDLEFYQPRVIVLETNSKEHKESCESYLKLHKYTLALTLNVNCFFVTREEDIEKLQNITLDENSSINLHPYGEQFTHKRYKTGARFPKK